MFHVEHFIMNICDEANIVPRGTIMVIPDIVIVLAIWIVNRESFIKKQAFLSIV